MSEAPPASIAVWWTIAGDLATDLLSDDELRRVRRLVNERDRAAHALSYALCRLALERETGIAARELRFSRRCATCGSDAHGMPRLLAPAHGVHFSLSRRGPVAVVAIARDMPVGVDAERDRRAEEWAEIRDVVRHAGDDPSLRDVELWTAKEAVLKASGYGLAIPPHAVSVSRSHSGAATAQVRDERFRAQLFVRWREVADGYLSAVASTAPAAVTFSRWSPTRTG